MSGFSNPVVRGHAPDPSAVRVGDDFFLANSSFEMLPGIPIRHSTDLVTWRIIGYAVTRPAQYRRDGQDGKAVLFAPTLRHHNGTFYLVCTNAADDLSNFLVTTTDPAGEWSDATWLDSGSFDPSLFRDDDGTWYYTRRTLEFREDGDLGPIVQTTIDIETGALGEFRPITSGNRGFASNDIEGPHLYRIGDWYYLSAAEGSSWKGHMQTLGRSRSPWGPFEPAPNNPVLTHRDRVAHPIQTVGHAEFVEDADGRWWALSLGTRHAKFSSHHNLGRETFLSPMIWDADGWPVIGSGGGTELAFEDVTVPAGTGTTFNVPDSLRMRGWTTIGAPHPDLDVVGESSDRLIDLPAGADLGSTDRLGALFHPQTDDHQRFSATVDASPILQARMSCGIAVYADPRHYYSAVVRGSDSGGCELRFRRVVDDLITERALPIDADASIRLTIDCTAASYAFTAEVGGETLELGEGSARLLSAEVAEWFVNVSFTLLAVSESERAVARFTDVKIVNTEPATQPTQLTF